MPSAMYGTGPVVRPSVPAVGWANLAPTQTDWTTVSASNTADLSRHGVNFAQPETVSAFTRKVMGHTGAFHSKLSASYIHFNYQASEGKEHAVSELYKELNISAELLRMHFRIIEELYVQKKYTLLEHHLKDLNKNFHTFDSTVQEYERVSSPVRVATLQDVDSQHKLGLKEAIPSGCDASHTTYVIWAEQLRRWLMDRDLYKPQSPDFDDSASDVSSASDISWDLRSDEDDIRPTTIPDLPKPVDQAAGVGWVVPPRQSEARIPDFKPDIAPPQRFRPTVPPLSQTGWADMLAQPSDVELSQPNQLTSFEKELLQKLLHNPVVFREQMAEQFAQVQAEHKLFFFQECVRGLSAKSVEISAQPEFMEAYQGIFKYLKTLVHQLDPGQRAQIFALREFSDLSRSMSTPSPMGVEEGGLDGMTVSSANSEPPVRRRCWSFGNNPKNKPGDLGPTNERLLRKYRNQARTAADSLEPTPRLDVDDTRPPTHRVLDEGNLLQPFY